MKTRISLITIVSVIFSVAVIPIMNTAFANSRRAVEAELNKPVIRGGIVFKHYCGVCHGSTGNGESRASKLYGKRTLKITQMSHEFYEKIIRFGGKAVGKSAFMPPWNEELSEEQIQDVVAYLSVIKSNVRRGEVIFKTNCILCHGVNADGKGRAAKLFNPPPADLTHSDKNSEYKEMIIRYGGKAMGRSDVMPAWSGQLTEQEIKDVVDYLAFVLVKI